MTKSIAVIVPAYNAQATIARALRSALAQEPAPGWRHEVIVVDDCSGDATIEAARACDDGTGRLKVYAQMRNGGPAAARNRGLAETDAAWFTPLDSDDFMREGRLANMAALAERGGWDVVADDLEMVFEDEPSLPMRRLWSDSDIGVIELSFGLFVEQNTSAAGDRRELGFIKPLIRRGALPAGEAVYNAAMRLDEDYELYARLLLAGARFCLTDPMGYVSVQRAQSLSRSQGAREFERMIAVDRRFVADARVRSEDLDVLRQRIRENRRYYAQALFAEAKRARQPLGMARAFLVGPDPAWRLASALSAAALRKLARPRPAENA